MSQEAFSHASSVLSRHAGTIVLGHLIVGALALSVIEGWGPSDSLYFCVTTLTTVGYGDLAPKSATGKLFTALHILVGCVIVSSCLGTLIGRMQASIAAKQTDGREAGRTRELNELAKSVGVAAAIIVVGMAYASFVEGWSMIDALYWAVVTVTTVGLGDLSPSAVLRPLAGVYLLLSVGGFAAAIGRVARFAAALELDRRREAFLEQGVTQEILDRLDSDGDGRVDRSEFLRFMLVASGQVEEGELAKLDALFDSLDADGSGDLHIGDIGRGPRPSLDSPRAQEMADLHLQHSEDSESGDGAALLQKGRKAVRSRPALG